MANIANIAINDGKSTPESHVYVPMKSGIDAQWKRTGVAGQPAVAMEQVTASAKLVETANGVNKIDIELSIPVLEQVTGGTSAGYTAAPALAHTLRAKVTFFAHQRSDVAGRKDMRVLLTGLLANAQIVDLVDNLTPTN